MLREKNIKKNSQSILRALNQLEPKENGAFYIGTITGIQDSPKNSYVKIIHIQLDGTNHVFPVFVKLPLREDNVWLHLLDANDIDSFDQLVDLKVKFNTVTNQGYERLFYNLDFIEKIVE